MLDREYFLRRLREHVNMYGGRAVVYVSLRTGGGFYVSDVVNTETDHVVLNQWVDKRGGPIQAPSSDAFSQEIPNGYSAVTLDYALIASVSVIPTFERNPPIGFHGTRQWPVRQG